MKEIWKDVPDYEGLYQVSDLGRKKSLNFKQTGKQKILQGCVLNTGYHQFSLQKEKTSKRFLAHQLVAMAFLNHDPHSNKIVVNHINFDKLDNRLVNLEVVSQRQNANRKHCKSKSKYIGVTKRGDNKKWVATIYHNAKIIYLGSFKTEIEASISYQKALKQIQNGDLITTNYKIKIMENNLKEFREKKGVTKYRMAKDLKVSYPTIDNWEKTDNLSPTKMKICADYLGMEVTEIFKI